LALGGVVIGAGALVATASLVSAGPMTTLRTAPGPAPADTAPTWGNAEEVPGLATLTNAYGSLSSLSCVSTGNCAAGGTYSDTTGHIEAFVVDESNGTWGNTEEVPGLATLNAGHSASVTSLSCASPGNCAAGGYYFDGSFHYQAFVVDETSGTWGNAQELPGLAALSAPYAYLNSISCASAGNCAAGGTYEDSSSHYHAFLAEETSGTWGDVEEVPGMSTLNVGGNAATSSLSCPSAGNCTAGGDYKDGAGLIQAFVIDESGGTWGTASEVPGSATLNAGGASVRSVSCASAGNCAAGGQFKDGSGHVQGFVVDEASGTWGNAEAVPGLATLNAGGTVSVTSVSCASAGNCAMAGSYLDASSLRQGFVVDETNGTWGNAEEVPGLGTLNADGTASITSISCESAGNCAAGGSYKDGSAQVEAFVADETGGTWGNAEEVPGSAALNASGNASVNSVSCAAGSCAAGGIYKDGSSHTLAFIVGTATVPDAPTIGTASAANGSASVGWTVPADNGATITGFVITPYIGSTAGTPVDVPAGVTGSATDPTPGAADSYSVTGLTNGTAYTFTVAATNSIGTGSASAASNAVTPATVPDAPASPSATAAVSSAKLHWTVPADNGATITGFVITPHVGSTARTPVDVPAGVTGSATDPTPGAADSYSVTGLTNGTAYTFTVAATNVAGTGTASAASNKVTPGIAPSITTGAAATAVVGHLFSFVVRTAGSPAPAIAETGTLPKGLKFVDNHNGTATISGTAATGSGGRFSFTLNATNPLGSAKQAFELTVDQAPAITSAASATATIGHAFSFLVRTTGYPVAAITETGVLPKGLHLVYNHNGTVTMSGTPAAGTKGRFSLTFKATNTVGTAKQVFVLTVI
jgi:hypothetical protein